jgi:hypothetical protein
MLCCILQQDIRSQAVTERQALGNLAAGTALALQPGVAYRLAPRDWLLAWRAYLQVGPCRRCGLSLCRSAICLAAGHGRPQHAHVMVQACTS